MKMVFKLVVFQKILKFFLLKLWYKLYFSKEIVKNGGCDWRE